MATKTPAKKTAKKPVKKTEVMKLAQPQANVAGKQMTKEQLIALLKKPQIFIPIGVLIAIVLVYLLRSWFVVASVNGQFVFRPAFEAQLEKQAGKQTLDTMITQMLVEQYAAKKGVEVSQSEVDTETKTINAQLAKQGQTLDEALAARGMSKSDFDEQIKLQKLMQKLLGNDIKVSDKDVQDYIDKNKDSLPAGESDAQIQATVRQQLAQQKLSTQAQALVQKLQAQAHISYFINL
ncbi:MAG TPA: SurA N-terminal domain-containing protein [Patescibacteria group bacterium]|nr:SurA N-terminal domain-containing protein [Patescibacteria group bacterium]